MLAGGGVVEVREGDLARPATDGGLRKLIGMAVGEAAAAEFTVLWGVVGKRVISGSRSPSDLSALGDPGRLLGSGGRSAKLAGSICEM